MPNQNLRHALIHRKAKFIDQFVDKFKGFRRRSNFPHKEAGTIIHFLFPHSNYSGRGAFKTAHKISSRSRDLVLKTSQPKNIANDLKAYKRIPVNLRNRYFAKIYWRTKYCLLQKHGRKSPVPDEKLKKLKLVAKKHGLTDVRLDNIRKIDGHFKIIDANVSVRRKIKRN
ncbi:MAG: hypothetical protein PHY43_14230 [Verrucomicrobiales bacterium]|nr:hypothetical protein [Verrucomicrobiales bacterium]